MSWRCRIGLHPGFLYQRRGSLGGLRWCRRCGCTWQSQYDGITASWRRRRDMKFGIVRRPSDDS